MDFTYVLSQIFTIIMYIFLALSYLTKKRSKILLITLSASIFGGLAYVLLGAWTGLAMIIIGILRDLYFFWDISRHGERSTIERRDIIALVVMLIAIVAATIPTYNGLLSLASFFATVVFSYSVWQKSPTMYKLLGIPCAALWITYNAFVGSLFGVILEAVLLVFSAYGYIVALKKSAGKKNGRAK